MSLLIPGEAKFSMGVSPTTLTASGQEKIDMSLDDLIKSRRGDAKKASRRSDRQADRGSDRRPVRRSERRRSDPKKPLSTLQKAAQNSSRRSDGVRKASRRAATNFRRGMRENKAPTQMEVDTEIRKEQNRTTQRGRKQILRGRNLSSRLRTPRPPTKKAIKAAVSAMTGAGFAIPDGMKIVINLEEDKSTLPERKNTNRGNAPRTQTNRDHPNKNNGGRLWSKRK